MKSYQGSVRWLIGLAVMSLALGACASGGSVKSDAAATSPQAGESAVQEPGENEAVVKSLAMVDQVGSCSLSFLTNAPPQYTVFKLSDPYRVIVDLPEFSISEQADLSVADNAFISSVAAEKIQDQDRDYLRLTIALRDDFSYTTTSDPESLNIIITGKSNVVAAPGKTTASETSGKSTVPTVATKAGSPAVISAVIPHNAVDGTSVEIVSDAPVGKYHAYTLQKPYRLVIDMPGAQTSLRASQIAVKNELINQIRLGVDPQNLRVVFDIASADLPQYQIAKQGNSLMVHLIAEAKAPRVDASVVPQTDGVNKSATVSEPVQEEAEASESADYEAESPAKHFSGPSISFDFKDADIKNVLRLIADISGRNMIISENVTGRVTLKLDNIPLDEALELILETNNLGSIVTKNITRIETRERIKAINEEKLLARKSHEEVVDLEIKTFDVSYSKAQDIAGFIKQLKVLSDRGSITSFKLTNKVTVKDIPENIPKIASLISEQDVPTRQVMIEARIVQSNPSFTKELGIRWGGTYTTTKDGDPITIGGGAGSDYIVNLPAAAGVGSGGAVNLGYIRDNLTLNMQLSALENDDKIKIVSNPRVIGLDNQEARIKQGVALPYLTLNDNGVTSTEFKDAVLELQVTPKITPSNTVAMAVKVTKNQKSSQTGADGEPGIDIRELETFLLIQSGVTAVIGGIYETTHTINIKRVPFFGTVPYVGYFFRTERQEEQLTELLIFITVTVLDAPENVVQDMAAVAG